jgi:hypothetical protein
MLFIWMFTGNRGNQESSVYMHNIHWPSVHVFFCRHS